MKRLLLISLAAVLAVSVSFSQAQWRCLYATWDDDANNVNATGSNTPSVGVIKENMFIALIGNSTENFMIPYVNADSSLGRRYTYGYGRAVTGIFQVWSDGGFDQVPMSGAFCIKATPDSLIYVANNDPEHNILVFKYFRDTIDVAPLPGSVYPRQITGTNRIFGIDVDRNGYVYVCNDTSNGVTNDVKIYRPIRQWTAGHADAPTATINLPDGIYKGLAVSPDGRQVFVSDYRNKRVLKYVGTPTTSYTQATGFSFQLTVADTMPLQSGARAGTLGLAYLSPNNILAVACDSIFGGGATYQYGRIYLLNPNTGAFVSSDTNMNRINAAQWNFLLTGGYQNRVNGKVPGNASGYASTYSVRFDERGNIYSQSHYGWTVEKWNYNGTLPTINSVEEIDNRIPKSYELRQNYPNPFNPVTTIEFAMLQSGLVTVKVYDLLGREVTTLVNEEKGAGSYRVQWDARNVPSGTYFYKMTARGHTEVRSMLLDK